MSPVARPNEPGGGRRAIGALSVSAVMPVYNGALYLAEAIESIRRQTRPPDEIVVVDDGSTDGSGAIASSHGPAVRCVRQVHGGVAVALNHGIRLARGALVAFLDADDLWTPTKLEHQLAALAAQPPVDVVFGLTEQFHGRELTAAERARHPFLPGAQRFYGRGAMLIRRGAFDRVGLFDPQYRLGEFVEWYLRLRDAGLSVVMMEELVLRRRIHGGNLGLCRPDDRQDYARILSDWRRRRRLRGGPGGVAVPPSALDRPGPGHRVEADREQGQA